MERAARPAQARMAHVAAGEMAEEVEPGETALNHYAAALELTDVELADADEEAELSLLTSAATAAAAAVAFRRAAAYVEQALRKVAGGRVERLLTTSAVKRDGAARSDAREVAAELSDQLGHYRRGGGDPVGAQQAFEMAVELAPTGAEAIRAKALASLAQSLMLEAGSRTARMSRRRRG